MRKSFCARTRLGKMNIEIHGGPVRDDKTQLSVDFDVQNQSVMDDRYCVRFRLWESEKKRYITPYQLGCAIAGEPVTDDDAMTAALTEICLAGTVTGVYSYDIITGCIAVPEELDAEGNAIMIPPQKYLSDYPQVLAYQLDYAGILRNYPGLNAWFLNRSIRTCFLKEALIGLATME